MRETESRRDGPTYLEEDAKHAIMNNELEIAAHYVVDQLSQVSKDRTW